MYSRFVFRSIQTSTPSVIFSRFLSLTQVQLAAATKLKEKQTTSDKSVEKTEQPSTPAALKTTNVSVEDQKPIPPPSSGAHDPNKTYSENIQRLVTEISKLSLVDVMDLNELLKVIFQNSNKSIHVFLYRKH
jgi:hypothetical protein